MTSGGNTTVREELITLVRQGNLEVAFDLHDDASLIRSGVLDSLALFHVATWIEGQVGEPLDLTAIDLWKEWDTIADILAFIERRRR